MSKIKFGIIGLGFMGQTHYLNLINNPKAEVKAVFTIPISSKPEIIDKNIPVYDDWKKMIDEADVDALVIATPTHTHSEIAEYAASKKKDLFIEKPMARTLEQCDRIIEAANSNGVKLFIGHVLRFWPSYRNIQQVCLNNPDYLKEIKMIHLYRFSGFPAWSKWFLNFENSGGVVLDLSIHDIDFSKYLLSEKPKSVYCDVQKIKVGDDFVPGISSTTLDFGNKIVVCEASWAGKNNFPFTAKGEIIGKEGIITLDGNSSIPIRGYSDEETFIIDPVTRDGYYQEMDCFIDSILNPDDDSLPVVTGADGREAVKMCLTAIKSAEIGRPIKYNEAEELLK